MGIFPWEGVPQGGGVATLVSPGSAGASTHLAPMYMLPSAVEADAGGRSCHLSRRVPGTVEVLSIQSNTKP